MALTPQLAAAIRDTVTDPVAFVNKFLGMDCWAAQARALNLINTPHARTVIKSCHSSGKTRISAAAVLWWVARWEDCIVITTAPTWNQVEKLLWGEVHSMIQKSKYPYPHPNKTELRIGPKRYAYGYSTSVTEQNEGVKFQGAHAEHVLIVIDEAPGVDPKIWGAIDGIRAGGDVRILAIGNPTIPSGPFADAFQPGPFNGWNAFTISAFDTPNFDGVYLHYKDQLTGRDVVLGDSNGRDLLTMTDEELSDNPRPYLTTKRWVKEKFFEWGPGHYLWDSRVLGNFPSQSEDSLISTDWLEMACESKREAVGLVHIGIDVAGPGEDETTLFARRGPAIIRSKFWSSSDPRGDVMAELKTFHKDEIATINVDSAGIGWGMYTHLRDEYRDKVVPINVGESPSNSKAVDKYANLKAELYWALRIRFQDGEMAGVLDPTTKKQLSSIRYKHNSKGKIEIESKDDMRKRGVKSPDRAEGLMLAYADVNQMILGALSIIKDGVEMGEAARAAAKVATSTFIKPEMAEGEGECPGCGSKAVVRLHGGFHCNQCGSDWGRKPNKFQAPNRSGHMAKIGR